jgi:DNA-binding CsgD family transcriptional regulator
MATARGDTGHPALTTRGRQVHAFLLAGRNNEQIARTLGISLRTVKFHVSNLLRKRGAANRLDLFLEVFLNRGCFARGEERTESNENE